MIKIIWRRFPILLGLIFCLLAVAVADDAATNRQSQGKSKSAKTSATLHKRHAIGGRHAPMKPEKRERHHRNIERFRTVMTAELAKLPALNRRMERLGEIQKRRYALQQLRQAAAAQTTTSREKVLKRFHTLLREDQELSDKARQVASEIVKDMPRIQKQLDARRAELNKALEETTATATITSGSEESKTESDLRRRLRYLNYIQDKLGDIKKHPERLDLLSRVLKGLPPDEDRWLWGRKDGEHDDAKRKRDSKASKEKDDKAELENLQKRRRDLQREMREIDAKIDNLKEDQ